MSAAPALSVLWPTPEQERVLDIAIGPDAAVAGAFGEWVSGVDLEGYFAYATFRLLPLVHHRLRTLGVAHPMLGMLRGVYRKSWCEAQALGFELSPVVTRLEQAGIATLLTKGAALQRTYYGNEGLRPMHDLDIVVQPAQAMAAMAVMQQDGWVRNETGTDEDVRYRHSTMFRSAAGREVDLHWYVMREARSVESSQMFWQAATPLVYCGVQTRQLCATDMLLHTIIHGVRANREPPLRWIADAMTVLRVAGPTIDWSRLLERAATLRLSMRLGLGLGYLHRRFSAPVPSDVLAALQRQQPSWVERVENTVVLADADGLYHNVRTKGWVMFSEYARLSADKNIFRFVDGFSHYVRFRSGARGRADLAGSVARGLARRISRALRTP